MVGAAGEAMRRCHPLLLRGATSPMPLLSLSVPRR
jgi:hypothetical protein